MVELSDKAFGGKVRETLEHWNTNLRELNRRNSLCVRVCVCVWSGHLIDRDEIRSKTGFGD